MVKRTFANGDTKSSLLGSCCTSADLSRCAMGVDVKYKEFSPKKSKQLKNCHEYGHSKSNYHLKCGYVGDLRDGNGVKSVELESNISKVTVDDEDFMHLDSGESVITSVGDRRMCSAGSAESEAVGAGYDSKPSTCPKRILIEDDSMAEWKKKRTINEIMSKDGIMGLVVELRGNKWNVDNDVILVDTEVSKEEESSTVMNGGPLWGMLEWLGLIAKDPCDPTIAPLPENTEWKNYSNENTWKQVLLAREALLLKRHNASGKQPVLQHMIDKESEAVGADCDNEPSSCPKSIPIEVDENDSETEWKKKRMINEKWIINEVMSEDGIRGLVVELRGNTCNGGNDVNFVDTKASKEEELGGNTYNGENDVILIDTEVYKEEEWRGNTCTAENDVILVDTEVAEEEELRGKTCDDENDVILVDTEVAEEEELRGKTCDDENDVILVDTKVYEEEEWRSNTCSGENDVNLVDTEVAKEEEMRGNTCSGENGVNLVDTEVTKEEELRGNKNDVILVETKVFKEEESSSVMNGGPLWGMLHWLSLIAKDPCDPKIVLLPEKTKWKNYGNQNTWKQVLLAREALLLKRDDASGKQPILQNNQRMHPCMYEDNGGSGYNFRDRLQCTLRLTTLKATHHPLSCSESLSLESRNNPSNLFTADSLVHDHKEDETPLGPEFQAFVPVWTGEVSESDSKWLGAGMWPLRRSRGTLSLIEKDPIGKGRQDSCRCQFRGSSKCVRFHIDEKRKKLKLELGAAFHLFKFEDMGEDVEASWTIEEQNKFAAIFRSNPSSQEKNLWVELVKLFPFKNREELVSYYVNVFLLRRRAFQNRISPSNIDSDDDEVPVVANANNNVESSSSIFYSPITPHSQHI